MDGESKVNGINLNIYVKVTCVTIKTNLFPDTHLKIILQLFTVIDSWKISLDVANSHAKIKKKNEMQLVHVNHH